MSNTRRLGVWMGRTMPAFRAGQQPSLRPRQLPLARYGDPAPAPRIRIPAALLRTRPRGDR